MSENLLNILQQARIIQQLAQKELNSQSCLCGIVDINSILESLNEIAKVMAEELQQKDELIKNVSAENQKLCAQIVQQAINLSLVKSENLKLIDIVDQSEQKIQELNKQIQHLVKQLDDISLEYHRISEHKYNVKDSQQASLNDSIRQQIQFTPLKYNYQSQKRVQSQFLNSAASYSTVKDKSDNATAQTTGGFQSQSSERTKSKQSFKEIQKTIFQLASQSSLQKSRSGSRQCQKRSNILKINTKENECKRWY